MNTELEKKARYDFGMIMRNQNMGKLAKLCYMDTDSFIV